MVITSSDPLPTHLTSLDQRFLWSENTKTWQPTRRKFLTGIGLAAVLTACGGPTDDSTDDSNSGMIDYSWGAVSARIPADPKRVVVIEGRGDLEFALLAGYPIVATRSGLGFDGGLPQAQFAGMLDAAAVTVLDSSDTVPNHEQIAVLQPDLIVMRVNAWEADWFGNEALTQIAPVLQVQVNTPGFRRETTEQLTALGRTLTMTSWMDRYDAAISESAPLVASALTGKKVAMITSQAAASGGTVLVWTNQLGTGVAADLGMEVFAHNPSDSEGFIEVSLENLGMLEDADMIFHQTTDPTTVAGISTWERLPAVRAGHSYIYPPAYNNGLVITATSIAEFLTASVKNYADTQH
ncbi:ABC transporter substrate-binding protein [Rhodococcus erythropolis]|uniref:ABC transporter substrate-binding protein n=1 Tax=Rhodococcus erythropolis TaxID=1833 RepID=UPI00378E2C48